MTRIFNKDGTKKGSGLCDQGFLSHLCDTRDYFPLCRRFVFEKPFLLYHRFVDSISHSPERDKHKLPPAEAFCSSIPKLTPACPGPGPLQPPSILGYLV